MKCNSSVLLWAKVMETPKESFTGLQQNVLAGPEMKALKSVAPLGLISVKKTTCKLDMTEKIFNVKFFHDSIKGEDVSVMMDVLKQLKPAPKESNG